MKQKLNKMLKKVTFPKAALGCLCVSSYFLVASFFGGVISAQNNAVPEAAILATKIGAGWCASSLVLFIYAMLYPNGFCCTATVTPEHASAAPPPTLAPASTATPVLSIEIESVPTENNALIEPSSEQKSPRKKN